MAVDVDSFTDNNIINGTLSHTVTVTPATVIDSVSYRVENSTLSNEVSIDEVGYTVDDIETGVNITLKPHILRHEPASTGAADIVITITDIYGRSVNVTDTISIIDMSAMLTNVYFQNINLSNTVDGLNTTDFYPVITANVGPTHNTGAGDQYILDRFKGPVIGTNYNIFKTEFVNDGEFVVNTSQPSQKVPAMVNDGALYVRTVTTYARSVAVPIAKLSDFLPTSWNEASIFDNVINTNTFSYKPNNSYLKLYTYNDGWDDRDYIKATFYQNATQSIKVTNDTYNTTLSNATANTSGYIADIIDSNTLSGTATLSSYTGGIAIPRFSNTKIAFYNASTSQTSNINESKYGITYSASSSNSSDKTANQKVCMHANNITSLLVDDNQLIKDRSWLIITNNAYINNQPATSSSVVLKVSGKTNISLAQ